MSRRRPVRCDALDRLRAGGVTPDRHFDLLFPAWLRKLSRTHFTPVAVAKRAAEWLVEGPCTRVLDVGSGVGKFCIVGAMTTEATFVGIEQRPRLVAIARALVADYGIERCRFRRGSMTEIDWRDFQGFYLYNPFLEHLGETAPFDETIERSREQHRSYVSFVEQQLARAAPGTRVATYYGFGGAFPAGWQLCEAEDLAGGRLELWLRG